MQPDFARLIPELRPVRYHQRLAIRRHICQHRDRAKLGGHLLEVSGRPRLQPRQRH